MASKEHGKTETVKRPRLYIDAPLGAGLQVSLEAQQAHYLKNVLRCTSGETVRLFNGKDGEWLGELHIQGKKEALLHNLKELRPQPAPSASIHVLFTPIKKNRMDFLIEKAVELGATHLHPVLTVRTEVRKINEERLNAQIIEAAEQCESMDIPALLPLTTLEKALGHWPDEIPLFACIERMDTALLPFNIKGPCAFLTGPEGGFDEREKEMILQRTYTKPVSLGKNILRAETAVLKCLCHIAEEA